MLPTEMLRMRQAVMVSPGVIEIREVEVPGTDAESVLVKIACIGICGSDIHVYHGEHPYTSYPVVQGHEVSGVVTEVGSGVSEFRVGDKVTIEPQVFCGKCYACRQGMYNICSELKVMGFQTEGAASDYVSVNRKHAVKLPDEMDLRFGAMIEPLAVGVRAVRKAGSMKGKQVLVMGAGPIGNLTAQTAQAMGAAKVMITDVNPVRLENALLCGIDAGVDVLNENLESRLCEEFGRETRADVIFECAGVQNSISAAVSLARKGSVIVGVAVYGSPPTVDMALVNECELTLIGTARYTKEDFMTAISLVEDHKIELEPLITDVVSLEQYSRAYRNIEDHPEHTMKVLIEVNAMP